MTYWKNQKIWAFLTLLPLVTTFLSALFLLPGTAAAKGEQIAADQLKQQSRLSFTLRDAQQTAYTVYIFADDEEASTLIGPDSQTKNKAGDVSYSGTYRAALLKSGASFGTVQNVKLELDKIILPQNWNFVVNSKENGIPDLLMITEWGASNVNMIKTFVIQSGDLKRVNYFQHNGKSIGNSFIAMRDGGIRALSGGRVQFRYYNNAQGIYEFYTFKINAKQLQMRLDDNRNQKVADWPNSGVGNRAYLKSLKDAASKGQLPGRTDITTGLTLQTVQKKLGKPKSKSNGEWGALYNYANFGIGFDSYLHELKSNSRVSVIELYNEKQYLSPGNIKMWLGKPSEEYYNEAVGGYEMIYKWGKHGIMFNYEEKEDLIDYTVIY
ncbi:DUF4309 domain-containing protein [Paenibacillus silvae]|uniref:DUF4309 domain-containing protein n=1 Tax=Paenibacillus silvae TaxID=1325358 RepID=UPI00119EA78F|nr:MULTISPECIES: DUF4309 domain-containing protein [Paenibacillus]MCK6073494.1 YjgB family protein [Paenibacillus silvae]MCK6149030.1 YjgB family protein [Paenibacillus silvae]MCK6267329.1 YjgB family protein [Paenibacillus silvae]